MRRNVWVHFKFIAARKMVLLRKVMQWVPWQINTGGGNAELFAMEIGFDSVSQPLPSCC